jgi:glycine/D-amino acid oxidase-like deaminating enzyme
MQEAIHENESGVSYSERSEAAPGLAVPSIEPELFMPWAVLAVEKAFLRALQDEAENNS